MRAIGAGMNQAGDAGATSSATPTWTCSCSPGRYTLLEQGALDDLLPECERRDVSIVAAGVFNSGLLARDRPPDDATYNYAAAPRCARRARAADRRRVRAPRGEPARPRRWPSRSPIPAVASVCVGARSRAQIARNAALFETPLPAELWAELRAEGLLREDAPLPGDAA